MPATQRGRHRHSSWPQAGQPGIGAQSGAGAAGDVTPTKDDASEVGSATRLLGLPSLAVVMPFEQEQAMGYLSA
jgi:hypothetical protein